MLYALGRLVLLLLGDIAIFLICGLISLPGISVSDICVGLANVELISAGVAVGK